tara:strand:+ start:169 stop:1986 length:1818 start_codon:yes stop_codon:yes gene_type:complete
MSIGCDTSTPLSSRFDAQVLRADSAIFDTLFDASSMLTQTNPLDRVDRQTAIDMTNGLNSALSNMDMTNYPTLSARVNQFPITYVEVADFIYGNNTDTTTLYPIIRDYNPQLLLPVPFDDFLSDLDLYFDANLGKTISGGVCGQFGNIFTKILGLFTLIDTAKALIDDIKNLSEKDPLKKIKSLTLQGVIKSLKENIDKIIKKLVKTIKKKIEAMVDSVTDTITDICVGAERMYKKLKKMADDIKKFFEEASIEKFVERIEKFIAETSAQFERLTVENVALLMFRFCQFTELLQSLLYGGVNKLTAIAQAIAVQKTIAKNASLQETASAVDAGAVRVSVESRCKTVNTIITDNNEAVKKNIEEIDDSSSGVTSLDGVVGDVLDPTSGRKSEATLSKMSKTPVLTPKEATPEELALVRTITEDGLSGYFTFTSSVKKNNQWQGIAPIVWVKLIRMVNMTSTEYVVNSGHRNKEYNKSVGGAKKSIHMSGYAIDIKVSVSKRSKTFVAAQYAGFTGIGIYSSFMHLDCGSRRMWVAGHGSQKGSKYPVTASQRPEWVAAIPKHVADAYRKNNAYSGINDEELSKIKALEGTLSDAVSLITDLRAEGL